MRLVSFILVVLFIATVAVVPAVEALSDETTYLSLIGNATISASIPDSPSSAQAYLMVSDPNDTAYFSVNDLEKIRENVTSASDAPQVAASILNNYGGLPPDAVITMAETEYLIEMNGTTQEEITRYPVSTNVQYGRKIHDVPVVGSGAYINILIGDNGELLYLNKVWRTVTPAGNISIIPVSAAIEKLRHGEVLNPKSYPFNVNITKIRLGYYEKGRNESQDYLDPAWLFKATTDTDEPIQYYVYARHFANFTVSETNISTFQTVNFTDTSETTPIRWHWEFGDGTNSTEQNPAHMYRTAGNFTVNLTAWNDMGSDTESKSDFVTIGYNKPINANFNASSTNVSMYQPVGFTDTSDASPTAWYWEFGDGTNSTLRNPTHVYLANGNFTVNLTAWNDLGNDTVVKTGYMTVTFSPPLNARFNATPTSASVGEVIQFRDTSNTTSIKWYWEFGDGTNSSLKNPMHAYPSNGSYMVNLTAWNSYGSDTSSKPDYITVYPDPKPVAAFTSNYSEWARYSPLTVQFTDQSQAYSNNVSSRIWDFGDGTNSTEQNPVHTFTYRGVYGSFYDHPAITLTITDQFGRTSTAIQDLYVYRSFVVDFTGEPTYGSPPLLVNLTDTSDGFLIGHTGRYEWNFGDGTSYSWATWDDGTAPTNISHEYFVPGNYSVWLSHEVWDVGRYSTYKQDYIVVRNITNLPAADFTANITEGRSPLVVAFSDTSTNSPVNWNWDFGDNTHSTEQNPLHVYTVPGRHTVSLRVMNDDGSDEEIKTDYITVLMELPTLTIVPPDPVMPIANFTGVPVSGKEPLAVVFNDTSSGYPVSWSWSFGDGETSPEKDPAHTYTSAGTYTVSLAVTNPYGENTTTKTDYITVLPLEPPVAGFSANTTAGNIPLAVAFTDTSSGSPTAWSWTFGNGGTSAEKDPVYVYLTPGQFTVSLTVTNPDGSNTTTKEQCISAGTPVLPVAEFTANQTTGNAPLAVGFTDQSTGSPASWHWTFGDGATSAGQNPSHTYTNTGTYTVSLEVTNPDGSNTRTKPDYITVTSGTVPPVASFTGKPTCGKAPLTVRFNDISAGNPTAWSWDFGDGTNTAEQNPVHVYMTAGRYTVSLTATNAGGSNTSTRKDYITVSGSVKPPAANFYGMPTSGRAPLAVRFTDTSTGSPTTWYWAFGDGTNASVQHPVHTYTAAGKYTVSLTASNAGGNTTKTRTQYITVYGPAPTPPRQRIPARHPSASRISSRPCRGLSKTGRSGWTGT